MKTIRTLLAGAACALALASAPARAQDPGMAVVVTDTHTQDRVSPPLPFDHWAVQAARRAEAMGLTRFFPAQRNPPRNVVARALREAAATARTPAEKRLADGWVARFEEEFPELGAARASQPWAYSASAAAGYGQAQGRLAPAVGYRESRQLPVALPDVDALRAEARAGISSRALGGEAQGAVRGGEAVLRSWDVRAALGAWQLGVGREPVGYGYGRTGGLVYSDPDPLPRAEVETARPIGLPSILRVLGPTTVHLFAGPVNDPARHPTNPWMWGMRVAIQPVPRLTLAANRGSIFGGDSVPVTPLRLAKMFVGVVHSEFENQVASGEVRYRLPTDRVLPATAYVEWGADDAAGAIQSDPARVIGLLFPALPGAPEAGAGVEYTYFKRGCCGHGPWYYNATFPGNWVVRDVPLGHPLGGEGAEYAAYAQADLMDARLRLEGRGWIADRSDLSYRNPRFSGGNLYTPQRTGRAHGGELRAAFRLLPRAEATLRASREQGDGWREQHVEALLGWTF